MGGKAGTARSRIEFRRVDGSHLRTSTVQALGETILQIGTRGKYNAIKAEDLVAAAKNPASPLHSEFDWDDESAATKFRITQARYLLRSINVVYTDKAGNEIETRAFSHVFDAQEDDLVYVPATKVWTNTEFSKQVKEDARRELRQWTDRYSKYRYLGSAVKSAKAILNKLP